MNVYRHELRAGFRSALIWSISLASVGILFLAIFPSFARESDAFMDILRAYPEAALKALGLTESGLNTFNGFYSFTVVYLILCACVQALILGASIIGKEGARGTSDFLFTRPMARRSILLAKYGAALTLILMSAALYALVITLVALMTVNALDMRTFALMHGAYALAQLLSLSIGFAVGCFMRRVKSPVGLGIGLGALFFALLMVDNLGEGKLFAFLTPMGYVNPSYIVTHSAYDPVMVVSLIALSALFTGVGVARYARRDIHVS